MAIDFHTQRRFWEKTKEGSGGCIDWTGAKYVRGYGEFYYNGRLPSALA